MLRCANLTLSVPGRVLCRAVDLSFERGELWAVLGRNGSGKSTFIHTVAGLALPAEGQVELDGMALQRLDSRTRARKLGVLLQIEESTYWGSVADYVTLGRSPHVSRWTAFDARDREAAHAALHLLELEELEARRYDTLSGGERQRARIAQLLAQAPGTFLLDEPLQHLDLAHQAHVVALMRTRARQHGDTVLMVMHEPLWIGNACTHALIFADGAVQAGPAEPLLTRDRLEHVYGCKLREVAHGAGRCFVPDV
jgi:iron complex transport system ATP-binding protein